MKFTVHNLKKMMRNREVALRLKNASIGELVYRARMSLQILRLRSRIVGKQLLMPKKPLEDVRGKSYELPLFEVCNAENISQTLLQMKEENLTASKRSIREFEQRNRAEFFADVNLKDAKVDIREVWEAGRLQHISLILLWSLQQNNDVIRNLAGNLAKRELLRWIENNPFLRGPHYMSAMECGLRIPVLCYCLKHCGSLTNKQRESILLALYQHTWWINKRLSLYGSLGNHTICECIGLLFAGAVYRKKNEGKLWFRRSLSLLTDELKHQILEDGGPAEQSLNYHRFVLDLYWLAFNFIQRNSLFNCEMWTEKLELGERFLAAFETSPGRYPTIGDSDDGHAVAAGVEIKRLFAVKAQPGAIVFEDSGYTVIRSPSEVVFTFDHGPLGMPPLYNHGHADALSITLSKQGKQILVDPGTFRYNGAGKFRKYLKGTRAHNTITVDGKDQAIQETSFIWRHPFNSRLIQFIDNGHRLKIIADHDGYSRIKEPVRHQRTILYTDEANFIIEDRFFGRGSHSFEINYHLHSKSEASRDNTWWQIKRQELTIYVKLLGDIDFDFVFGSTEPSLGWYSPEYGTIEKCGVLSSRRYGYPDAIRFITVICTEAQLAESEIAERLRVLDDCRY